MRRYGAGLVDAGASSAATFVAGVAAARLLDLQGLGSYALVFAALLLVTQLPTQMVFVPTEARLVQLDASARGGHLWASMRVGIPWTLIAAILTFLVGLFLTDTGNELDRWSLAVTGAVATLVSPIQDHVRRMLHLSGRHRDAAWVSAARAGIVLATIVGGSAAGARAALLPLGALAIGDLLSMVLVVGSPSARRARLPFSPSELRRSGSWLLVSSMAAPAAGLVTGIVVTGLASSSALGAAEAARVTAQPLLVLAGGLAAVLGPEAMEAAHKSDRRRANALSKRLAIVLGVATAVYLSLTWLPDGMNPLKWAIPAAFEMPGLTQLSVLAAALNAVVLLQRSELVVLERTRSLAGAEVVAGSARAGFSFAALWWHAWVVPLGFMIGGGVRMLLFRRALR